MSHLDQMTMPTCALPGCQMPAAHPTQPCPDCVTAFGTMLQRNDTASPITPVDIARPDVETLAALDRMRATARPADGIGERKAGQICWLCEERRTCTRMAAGWECRARQVPTDGLGDVS